MVRSPALDGMIAWKKASKLSKKQLDDVADFVATFATLPDDMTPDEWQNLPGVSTHPGLEPFTKECGTCHVMPGLTEGGDRDSPQLFGWGSPRWTARMIRKPGAADMYGYLEKERPDALLRRSVDRQRSAQRSSAICDTTTSAAPTSADKR